MVSKKLIVTNEAGLHVRPAGVLSKAAEASSSKVEIIFKYNIINAKSLLNILSASIGYGDEIEIRCSGPKEQEDLERLVNLLEHLE